MRASNITKDVKIMILDDNRDYLPDYPDEVMGLNPKGG